MKRIYLFIVLFILTPLSVSAQSESLTTLFAANNNFAGNMFDVSVSEDICINGFDVNLNSPNASETINVYYKTGSYLGTDTNPSAWTRMGSAVVAPQGLDNPTPVPIGGLTLSSGTEYGFYVSLSSYGGGNSIAYTNGGPNVYSNSVMTITTGVGNAFPEFIGAFSARQWNGTIHYTLGACSSASASVSGERQPAFHDGRINNFDVSAPVAVYPHFVNGEIGLIIYNSDGVQMLVITPEEIANAPENPETNTLIAEANDVTLYRLAGGSWQINAPQYNGKTYVLIFDELYVNVGYTSYEEN